MCFLTNKPAILHKHISTTALSLQQSGIELTESAPGKQHQNNDCQKAKHPLDAAASIQHWWIGTRSPQKERVLRTENKIKRECVVLCGVCVSSDATIVRDEVAQLSKKR